MWLVAGIQWLFVTILSMYILIVLLRFILQWHRISLFSPLGQVALALTERPVAFIRQWIRSAPRTDWPSLFFAYLLSILMVGIQYHFTLHPISLISIGFIQMISLCLSLYFYALIAFVVLSWLSPHHPLLRLMGNIVQSLLNPIRRIIPPIGGLDLTPIIAILILKFIELFLLGAIIQFLLR